MDLTAFAERLLERLPPRAAETVFRTVKRLPPIGRSVEANYRSRLASVPFARPVPGVPAFTRIPPEGREHQEVLEHVSALAEAEADSWQHGHASGAVYHGDEAHIDFLSRVYELHSQSNPLHTDLWPSGVKFETEIVSMTADMLKGDREVVGTVTSGGTESIVLAMKAYRDRSGRSRPEIVAPTTAHVAFDKAAQYLGMRLVRVPVRDDFTADVAATRRALSRRTVVVVGSAPGFPHGVIDPIPELSELARERGIGFHTDACLGGFVLPWAERLGVEIPPFDFRLPGVTSMSADTHKYGYAAKGTSVVLYRGRELRRHQYFTASDWPGGLYYSTTIAGSRPGALIASTWAAMVSMGEDGYLSATRRILDAADAIRRGIDETPDVRVLGDPLWVIAFRSDTLDNYEIMERMHERGWSLVGLQRPPALHIAVTLRHAEPGVTDRFIDDLRETVAEVRSHGRASTGSAPVYGMAATFPIRGVVTDLLERYVDRLYER